MWTKVASCPGTWNHIWAIRVALHTKRVKLEHFGIIAYHMTQIAIYNNVKIFV